MDKVWVALGATTLILVGLSWCVWWLVADAMRKRRRTRAAGRFVQRYRAAQGDRGRHRLPAHAVHGDDDDEDLFDTVPRLLERAIQAGQAIRLNWSEENEAQANARRWLGVRPYVQDQVGTGVMGRVEDEPEYPA